MNKRARVFFTLIIALVMVFASPAYRLAAAGENTVLVMEGKVDAATHEIEIRVTVEENTGVCGMLLSLVYDTSVFTLIDLDYGPALSSLAPIHTNTETEAGGKPHG